jgi:hypothetical protein
MLPITEAVQRLEAEGLLESRPQVGTRVRIPSEQDIREQFIIREALESQSARMFAERASLVQRQELGLMAEHVDVLFNQSPHNFAISAGYELPIGRGKRFLSTANGFTEGLLGGWQFQGILVARSGVPFTPTISGDRANTGVGNQRPDRIGSGTLDNPTVEKWFDTSAFVVPALYTYGNSGASILRAGRYFSLDFSIFKDFKVTERSRLQFRAEAFNLTNTPSFNPPQTAINTASGGRVTSTLGAPRQLQFALKFLF